uniref:Uncharacterized protein n=1 Tax=Medicago truncatula TaxID=3880 RepID=A2Q520_MEDTR|nr:hypothetical protein MtrDRAFT_AC158497g27v2 [Medicago truncatula]
MEDKGGEEKKEASSFHLVIPEVVNKSDCSNNTPKILRCTMIENIHHMMLN